MTGRETTAATWIVRQLETLGADTVFGVPGESFLAVLDALRDSSLRFITCRQEGGAGYAAEAHGKLTGRPGLLMVTRGPGVTNAAVAVHTAQQDETPLLVMVGEIPARHRGRDAFQEISLPQMFAGVAKWVAEIDRPQDAPEVVARAWALATAGRPGPVIIGLPEDRLELVGHSELVAPPGPRITGVAPSAVAAFRAMLADAERPVVVVGGSRWSDRAIERLPLALSGLPAVTGFRRQDLVDHRSADFAGSLGLGADPALLERMRRADLVIVVGDRLSDATTDGFRLFDAPAPRMRLVHVHTDPAELGLVHRPDLAIVADPEAFVDAVASGPSPSRPKWAPWTAAARAGYVRWSGTGGDQEAVIRGLRAVLADDAIVTHGAGNFTRPVQRAFTYYRPGRQLAPASGSMGYGLPAALAAAIAHPDRQVVCVAGDGDLLMTGQELATAAHVGASLTVLVVNNAAYGTIRSHQERRYPGREVGTGLTNPDFVRFGQAFGAHAELVVEPEAAIAAVTSAVHRGGLNLIEYRV